MVWETCEVWFVSFYLLSLLSTNVKNVLGHALLPYAPHKTSHNSLASIVGSTSFAFECESESFDMSDISNTTIMFLASKHKVTPCANVSRIATFTSLVSKCKSKVEVSRVSMRLPLCSLILFSS